MKNLTPSFRMARSYFPSRKRFAVAVGVDHTTVIYWEGQGFIPEKWAGAVEVATGGGVTAVSVLHDAIKARAVRAAAKGVS